MRKWFRLRGGFSLAATLTLAVSVGVNLLVFTFVNALWVRPMPFADGDRLVTVLGSTFGWFDDRYFGRFSATEGQTARDFAGLEPQLRFDEVGRELEVLAVTAGYFRLLGVPIHGRDFVTGDDHDASEPVAIISDRLWSREFGRREDVIGSVIPGRPIPVRIVGIAPPGFEGAWRGERTDVWVPRSFGAKLFPVPVARQTSPMIPLARLAPGDSVANADRRLKEKLPSSTVVPLQEVFGAPGSARVLIRAGREVGVAAGVALLVLFGGCAAIAALVLVHYERRRLELAIRVAVGASRSQLVGLLLRELGSIAVLGSAGALVVSSAGIATLPSLSLTGGVDLARLDVSLDWRVFVAGCVVTVISLGAASLMPIVRFSRVGLAGELLGPGMTASAAAQRVRQVLLGTLAGATVVVLAVAGLFVRAVERGFSVAPGFDVARTTFVTAHLVPPLTLPGTFTTEDLRRRTAMVREAIQSIPGVAAAAEGPAPIGPLATSVLGVATLKSGAQLREARVAVLQASPNLLEALGVAVRLGRGLSVADTTSRPVPAVVTKSLARRMWTDANPIGQVLSGSRWRGGSVLVVGVADDFAFGSLTDPVDGVVVQATDATTYGIAPRYVVRSTAPGVVGPSEIRHAIEQVLPGLPPAEVATGTEIVAADLGRQRLGAWFFSGFGLVALVVGVGSVFGMVAYLAESRTRECGLRLALGATPGDLLRLGVMTALRPVSFGVVCGLVVSAILAHWLTALLVGVSALDIMTYVLVAVTMLMAAAGAAVSAAWRLRGVAPSSALRTN